MIFTSNLPFPFGLIILTLYFATELEEGVIFTILISLYLSTGPNVYDVSPGCKTIVSSFSLINNVIVTIQGNLPY